MCSSLHIKTWMYQCNLIFLFSYCIVDTWESCILQAWLNFFSLQSLEYNLTAFTGINSTKHLSVKLQMFWIDCISLLSRLHTTSTTLIHGWRQANCDTFFFTPLTQAVFYLIIIHDINVPEVDFKNYSIRS